MTPPGPQLEHLHAVADDLVAAVHALDRVAVDIALVAARRAHDGHHGDPLAALAVLLAAAVTEDAPTSQHVVWTTDPARYARMRSTGMLPPLVCAVMADIQEPPRA